MNITVSKIESTLQKIVPPCIIKATFPATVSPFSLVCRTYHDGASINKEGDPLSNTYIFKKLPVSIAIDTMNPQDYSTFIVNIEDTKIAFISFVTDQDEAFDLKCTIQ